MQRPLQLRTEHIPEEARVLYVGGGCSAFAQLLTAVVKGGATFRSKYLVVCRNVSSRLSWNYTCFHIYIVFSPKRILKVGFNLPLLSLSLAFTL